jgi:alkylation response protein AidB-like acyl-CoA dehydrogenase
VPFAPVAAVALVVATGPDGPGLFAADLDLMGRPAAEPAMDLTRPLAWLALDAAPAWRLGGAEMVDALLDLRSTATALEMLGGAERALELAVDYAKERVQFGRPIGSFQAVKHRCADMLVDVEGMRSTSYWAAWCLGADDPDRSIAASTAKTWGSDASKRVMAGALQVHGGIGFTWEHDLHLFLKRAQLDQVSFGDSVAHRERLARLLRPKVDAGESVI